MVKYLKLLIPQQSLPGNRLQKERWHLDTMYIWMMKLLIQVNSGHSSKAFFLVSVTLIGLLMLLVVCFILVWEVVTYGTIKTDLMGLSAFVGSVASLFVTAGITKTIGERGEHQNINDK